MCTGKYTTEPFSSFPSRRWDSLAYQLSLVMTGWHAKGIPQLPSSSFDDRRSGALALCHWKELTSRIPKTWRGNPWAIDYPDRLPLQIMELSAFQELCPSSSHLSFSFRTC